jgi:hypothetical protein
MIQPIIGGEASETYIGYTTQELDRKLRAHKSDYNKWLRGKKLYLTSFVLFEKYGFENCKITLVDDNNVYDTPQQKKAHYIHLIECCNKNIIGQTPLEYRAINKDKLKEQSKLYGENNKDKKKLYRDNNKDKIREQQKQYDETNKEKKIEYQKVWRDENKDKTKEYGKKYKDANRDSINLKRRELAQQKRFDKAEADQELSFDEITGGNPN